MKHTVVLLTTILTLSQSLDASADAGSDRNPHRRACTGPVSPPDRGTDLRVAATEAHNLPSRTNEPALIADSTKCTFSIPAMSLERALKWYTKQAAVGGRRVSHLIASNDRSRAFVTRPLEGVYGVAEAAQLLVEGSTFVAKFTRPNRVVVTEDAIVPERVVRDPAPVAAQAKLDEVTVETNRLYSPTVPLVPGGLQPNTVINRRDIEHLGAGSESVLHLLTLVNGSLVNRVQTNAVDIGKSQIDLRGLGTEDSQVLLDGRRIDVQWTGGTRGQGDVLRALPASAVERIEFHPASAAGIYGGGATAGVLNIVLRRDCPGGRLTASYGNSFKADTSHRSMFVSECFRLFGDRTSFSFFVNDADEDPLYAGNRDYLTRGRMEIFGKNPSFFPGGAIPPVGAQTNIASVDGTGLGGQGTPSFLTVPVGYTRAQGLEGLLNGLGRYNLELADTSQPEGGRGSVIRNGPHTRYLNSRVLHKLSDRLAAYADFTSAQIEARSTSSIAPYTRLTGLLLPAGVPGNPFDKAVYVTAPAIGGDGPLESRANSRRLIGGVYFESSPLWKAGLELTHALRKQRWSVPVGSSVADAVISGELDVFSNLNTGGLNPDPYVNTQFAPDLESRANAVSFRTEVSLFRLRSGNVMLRAFAERRREEFEGGTEYITQGSQGAAPMSLLTAQKRDIKSAYLEVRVPMGSPVAQRAPVGHHSVDLAGDQMFALSGTAISNPSATVPRMELQLAGRFDEYVTTAGPPRVDARSTQPIDWATSRFHAFNPTIAFRFRPISALVLRTSFGTGFVPPSGDQLAPPALRLFPAGVLRDPRRGNEPTGPIYLYAGGNPSTLKPEHSRSWSAGISLAPGAVGQLAASVDYVEIKKSDNIASPADLAMTNFPLFEARHPKRVTRASSVDGDPYTVGAITAIDASDINIAQAKVRAWELDMRYQLEPNQLGLLSLLGHVTWQPELSTRATPDSPAENNVAVTAYAPLRLSALGGATLTRGHAQFSWITRYSGKYQVSRDPITLQNQGARKIGHQTYHDVAVTYRMPVGRLQLDSLEWQATVHNVFDREPPLDAGNLNYFSPFADPRGAVYGVSLTARF